MSKRYQNWLIWRLWTFLNFWSFLLTYFFFYFSERKKNHKLTNSICFITFNGHMHFLMFLALICIKFLFNVSSNSFIIMLLIQLGHLLFLVDALIIHMCKFWRLSFLVLCRIRRNWVENSRHKCRFQASSEHLLNPLYDWIIKHKLTLFCNQWKGKNSLDLISGKMSKMLYFIQNCSFWAIFRISKTKFREFLLIKQIISRLYLKYNVTNKISITNTKSPKAWWTTAHIQQSINPLVCLRYLNKN